MSYVNSIIFKWKDNFDATRVNVLNFKVAILQKTGNAACHVFRFKLVRN